MKLALTHSQTGYTSPHDGRGLVPSCSVSPHEDLLDHVLVHKYFLDASILFCWQFLAPFIISFMASFFTLTTLFYMTYIYSFQVTALPSSALDFRAPLHRLISAPLRWSQNPAAVG